MLLLDDDPTLRRCLELPNRVVNARGITPLLRKPLTWYRSLRDCRDKRALVFGTASEVQIRAMLQVCDQIDRGDDGEPGTSRAVVSCSLSPSDNSYTYSKMESILSSPEQSASPSLGWAQRSKISGSFSSSSSFAQEPAASGSISSEVEKIAEDEFPRR